MPIHINLLAEALAEEELRRRDPAKRAKYLGVLLTLLALCVYAYVFFESKFTERSYADIQSKISSKSNECAVVNISLKKIEEARKQLSALNKLSNARLLEGNLLNALQKIHVPNVQLIRLRLEQTYALLPGTPAKTNNFRITLGQPATSTEHIQLTIDAKDFSPNPGDQVNHYKEKVIQSEYFKALLESNNSVKLANLSPPQVSVDGKSFVQFTLECRFQEKTR